MLVYSLRVMVEKKKAGWNKIPPGLHDRNYFESPIVLGAGAG
jgi:hypothetical protein